MFFQKKSAGDVVYQYAKNESACMTKNNFQFLN